jgi:hypothetical protein
MMWLMAAPEVALAPDAVLLVQILADVSIFAMKMK